MADIGDASIDRRYERPVSRKERSPTRPLRDDRYTRDERDDRRRGIEGDYPVDAGRYSRDRDGKRRKSLSPRLKQGNRSPPSKRPFYDSRERGRGDHARRHGGNIDSGTRKDGATMLTYKQFMMELDDDVSPIEAERRYAEYKAGFAFTQKLTFFEQHKHEDWLRDKYDPRRLEDVLVRRNENAKSAAKEFMESLSANQLNLGPTAVPPKERAEDADVARKKRNAEQREQESDIGPPTVVSPTSDAARVAHDIRQALKLVQKLDAEKSIPQNPLLGPSEGLDPSDDPTVGPSVTVRSEDGSGVQLAGVQLLEVAATYLWRVHSVDYFGGVELKGLPRGLRTVRVEEEGPGKESDTGWARQVDGIWGRRLQEGSEDPLVQFLGQERVERSLGEALETLVRRIRDEKYGWKYGCGADGCSKLFHGPEFVLKHLRMKHPDVVDSKADFFREEVYKANFMGDPDAPVPANLGASLAGRQRRDGGRPPGDRTQGILGRYDGRGGRDGVRRPPMDADLDVRSLDQVHEREREGEQEGEGEYKSRVLDDRGRMEGGRFDRPTLSREVDPYESEFAGRRGGFDGGVPFDGPSLDPQFADAFDSAPARMPFGSQDHDFPPMLIPVHGAGPLGPFVAAPPDVALRMMRERGAVAAPFFEAPFDGPIYDDEGGEAAMDSRYGGRGRGPTRRIPRDSSLALRGGDVGGFPLPTPVGMRPDPRHVKSYKDLDAPDDGVPVIDYRSLS